MLVQSIFVNLYPIPVQIDTLKLLQSLNFVFLYIYLDFLLPSKTLKLCFNIASNLSVPMVASQNLLEFLFNLKEYSCFPYFLMRQIFRLFQSLSEQWVLLSKDGWKREACVKFLNVEYRSWTLSNPAKNPLHYLVSQFSFIFFSVSLNVKFSFDLIFLIEISYVAILICQSRILLFPTKILYNKLFRYLNFVKIYLQFVPTLKGKRSTQTFNLACTVLKRFLLLKFPD